jgi:SAM-dependent methyltransferase
MTEDRKVADQVKELYDSVGWTMVGDVTFDAQTSEDLRNGSKSYLSACRLRVLKHLPETGDRLLDMASGPIQYPEYLRYSENFKIRVCVDLSHRALEMAAAKLGAHGEFHVGDFLALPIAPVDAAVSLHTIYHINKDQQEAAVRKLISLTRSGGTIVIVYSNPAYFVSAIFSPLRKLIKLLKPSRNVGETPSTIYFHRFPITWWSRFADSGTVSIYPWRTFSSREQRLLFFDNWLGSKMLSGLFKLEERFPRLFRSIGCYPMIVIKKA